MSKNQYILPLDKTPDTNHLYENYEVQEVLYAYSKDLKPVEISSIPDLNERLRQNGDSLLLLPRDINDDANKQYDFANNGEFQGQEIDMLTPRLKDFKDIVKNIVENPEIISKNQDIQFLVPIRRDKIKGRDDHWYGAIISYNPNDGKYTYTFLDSLQDTATTPPPDIKKKFEKVFLPENLIENTTPKGFYNQGKVACGACLSANLMMNAGVLEEEKKVGVDIELRQEHFRMVPEMGWRNQPKTQAIADAIFLISSSDAKNELRVAMTHAESRNEFIKVCDKWKQELPENKEYIIEFQSSVNKLFFNGKGDRKPNVTDQKKQKIDARLSELDAAQNPTKAEVLAAKITSPENTTKKEQEAIHKWKIAVRPHTERTTSASDSTTLPSTAKESDKNLRGFAKAKVAGKAIIEKIKKTVVTAAKKAAKRITTRKQKDNTKSRQK